MDGGIEHAEISSFVQTPLALQSTIFPDGYSMKAIIGVEYHFDAYAAAFSDKDFAW